MSSDLQQRCRQLVQELGLGRADEVRDITPLTGGVASDIASLWIGDRQFCLKFALPKLKVAADWFAPVHRNAAEYEWLKVAAEMCPQNAVQLFGRSEDLHGFAMDFVAGPNVYLWKSALLQEARIQGEAALVGEMIGRIHAASTAEGFNVSAFQNAEDFRALRIDPYLTFTAESHPELKPQLTALAKMLFDSSQVLVHGDVSPKNILMRAGGLVILDAECATMGDASFDPSFCLNHLILKAIHLPMSRGDLLRSVRYFWTAYASFVTWERPQDLEARICKLLPALMLGRVDGKSPVEYLSENERQQVREIATRLIVSPTQTLGDFTAKISTLIKEQN